MRRLDLPIFKTYMSFIILLRIVHNTTCKPNLKYVHVSRINKNRADEKPGWNDHVLKWCLEAPLEKGVKKGTTGKAM